MGVDTSITPTSPGALAEVPENYSNRDEKTASFNLRADYALPSSAGFSLAEAYVFWPLVTDVEYMYLYYGDAMSSDHYLVGVDLFLEDFEADCSVPASVPTSVPTSAPIG